MRAYAIVSSSALLAGCAFPQQVNRFGVEYNSALASMNNEQTLLNILRARDGMPTHFSSVSQFRGTINLTAGAGLNAQLNGSGVTDATGSGTSSTTETTTSNTTTLSAPGAPPGTQTVASTVATPVATTSLLRTVARTGDVFTPQVSGQIASGTAFDVDVYDTQKFFQGITGAVPFSTIESFLAENIDDRTIALLLIARVDFRIEQDVGEHQKGTTIRSLVNDPNNLTHMSEFRAFVECYELGSATIPKKMTPLIALSRITRGADGKLVPLELDKIVAVDGEKFDFSQEAVPGKPDKDDDIYLDRVTAEQRVARLSPRFANCKGPNDRIVLVRLPSGKEVDVAVPVNPPPDPIYLGEDYALLFANGKQQVVKVRMEITARSPEGVYRYLGAYLANGLENSVLIDGKPLFSIADGRFPDALAQANYRRRYYSLVNLPGTHQRNAQIFTILQQLINLQKEASERPTTIPVRAIP